MGSYKGFSASKDQSAFPWSNSVDMSDDASSSWEPHASLVEDVQCGRAPRDALAYLLRYETMVRQQEAEDMATIEHLRPCIKRLIELSGRNDCDESLAEFETSFLDQEISTNDISTALKHLEDNGSTEHFMTDRQLMLILRMLSNRADDSTYFGSCLTWAEVVQCYKVCISGMVTLQHLPPSSTNHRDVVRDRTLAMLSLFESTDIMLSVSTDQSSTESVNSSTFDDRQCEDQLQVSSRKEELRSNMRKYYISLTFMAVLVIVYGTFASNPAPLSSKNPMISFNRLSTISSKLPLLDEPLLDTNFKSELRSNGDIMSPQPDLMGSESAYVINVSKPSLNEVNHSSSSALVYQKESNKTIKPIKIVSAVLAGTTALTIFTPSVMSVGVCMAVVPSLVQAGIYGWGMFSFLSAISKRWLLFLTARKKDV